MYDVVTIGMCSVDNVIVLDSYPVEDAKLLARQAFETFGGMAANVAANLAKLGCRTALVADIGSDRSRWITDALGSLGVATNGVRPVLSSTLQTWILVNCSTGSRTAIAEPPAEIVRDLSEQQVAILKQASHIYLDGSQSREQADWFLTTAQVNGKSVFYNCEFLKPGALEIFRNSDCAVMSGNVALQLTDRAQDYRDLLLSLWEDSSTYKGITFGRNGSLFYDGRSFFTGPVYPVAAIDTTGAGDAFQSGLVLGLHNDWDLEYSLAFAAVLAGITCTELGARANDVDIAGISAQAGRIANHNGDSLV